MPQLALYLAGGFAVLLGLLHFTFPERFGFPALLCPGPPVEPFRLGPYRYNLSRGDVLGIVYVMNHCVSFVILSIGVFDLFVGRWWSVPVAACVSLWCSAFWLLRAGSQLYLGRRRGDFLVMFWFVGLGAIQLLPSLA